MEDRKQILAKALANAKVLTQNDDLVNRKVKEKRNVLEQHISGGNPNVQNGGFVAPEPMDYSPQAGEGLSENFLGNSRMPREIVESLMQTPPMEGVDERSTSVLDSIMPQMQPQMQSKPRLKPQTRKQPVYEQNDSFATPIQQSAGVDYSLIKTIVDESVKKYMTACVKKIMGELKSESGNIGILHLGDDFTVVTDDGDLYKADLRYVKNIKQKK